MSAIPRKVFIQVDTSDEQESIKNSRKTLKVLQKEATNKENLIGRSILPEKSLFKKSKSETAVVSSFVNAEAKRRKSSLSQDSAEKQLSKVTEEDLTTEGEPSEGYWKVLAEKRRVALDISLKENEDLHEKIESLEEELVIARAMLDESKNLVEVLTEMIQDPGNDSGLPNSIYGECSQSITTDDDSVADDAEDDIGHESMVIGLAFEQQDQENDNKN